MRRRFYYVYLCFKIKKIFQQFKLVIADTGKQIKEAELLLNASSLAYITILSIIPLLAVSFSIFQAFGGMQKLYLKFRESGNA